MKRAWLALLAAVTVALLGAVLTSRAAALTPVGGGLCFQSPQPVGWSIVSLAFRDAENLWAVVRSDETMGLVHSKDKGDTWQYIDLDLPDGAAVQGLTFTDDLHARAFVSWNQRGRSIGPVGLLRSDDGGAAWTLLPIATADFLPMGQAFPTSQRALLMGREYDKVTGTLRTKLLRTTDGGASWRRARVPCAWPFDFAAPDSRHLWFVDSDTAKIWTSTDGGSRWVAHRLPLHGTSGSAFDVVELQALSANVAWVKVNRQARPHELVMRTTNGGRSWKKVAFFPDATENGLEALSANEVWLSVTSDSTMRDTSCYVSHTLDGGATWTRSYVGPRSLGVTEVGPDGTLYSFGRGMGRSTDNGAHWTRLIPDAYEYWFGDVAAGDGGQVWAVGWTTPFSPGRYGNLAGEEGLLFRCEDGVSWKQQEIAQGTMLTSVDFAGTSGWIGGLEGRVLRTLDGGTIWSESCAGASRDIADIKCLGPESAAAVANDRQLGKHVVLLTTDGGLTWTERPAEDRLDVLRRIAVLSPSHILVAGTRYRTGQALLLETTDSGATWTQRLLPDCTRPVRDMAFVDANHGWILASQGIGFRDSNDWGTLLLRTVDGGATWMTFDLGKVSASGILAMCFEDESTGWLFGDHALKTSDGGLTWNESGAFLPSSALGRMFGEPVLRAAVMAAGDVWAVGADQAILSTVDTAADTAPPLTTDDGDRLWHNTAVTTHLYSADPGGSGVAMTEYRLDGGSWNASGPDGVTVEAPADHSADGDHRIEYRSTDVAGNSELVELCTVHVDTRQPTTVAGTVRVRSGSYGRLPFEVLDEVPCGRRATVRFAISDRSGDVVKRLLRSRQLVNASLATRFRCNLAPGTYSYTVTAVDAAGNAEASAGQGKLIVTK